MRDREKERQRETERQRQTDRQTDRERERERCFYEGSGEAHHFNSSLVWRAVQQKPAVGGQGPTIAERSGGGKGGKEGARERERESLIGTMLHNGGYRAPACTCSASPYADLVEIENKR